ncbi:DUF4893 domain-containing protein [Loktanella sp. TSTF-M6]|uniref:DUF4893 domain-containing protein n=1 Tax=Loktanella gaetbuli TaxID=2881335 RepID=A0ABS8BUT2_9RHOB|nr:DUF4893 domain-containing protein [Loktanella gaetbuli]MCB5199497.1 DUF4893 domain-containing protein [Loktanella gaetbuli]
MLRTAVCLALLASPLAAQDMLRPADQVRLDALDAAAGSALLTALAGGGRGDVDLLQEVMEGAPLAPIQTTLPGDWQCRTLKLGGEAALVVYAAFDCTITTDGDGFILTKTTGSQRLTGRITLAPEGMVLTATGHVAEVEPIAYADLADDFETDGTLWPIVGRVEQPAPDRARILMPLPALESEFDVLSLRR